MVRIVKQIVEKIRRTLETPEVYARRIRLCHRYKELAH